MKKIKGAKQFRAFTVYLKGKAINMLFYSAGDTITPDEVKRSLVNHDGYDPSITVEEED